MRKLSVLLACLIAFPAFAAVTDVSTPEKMKAELAKPGTIVLLYTDPERCGPCAMLEPIYEEVSREMKDVRFLRTTNVRLKEHADMVQFIPFGVMGRTESEFRNKPCKPIQGYVDKKELIGNIRKCLKGK